jgi:hypothetical protein
MIMQNPERGADLLDAVKALGGRKSAYTKLRVIKAVHDVLEESRRIQKWVSDRRLTVRVEVLIPLLAEIVVQPDVARILVGASQRTGESEDNVPRGMPSLRALMEDLLMSAYSPATQVAARVAITEGATHMLEDSLNGPSGPLGRRRADVAGRVLGAAASAQEEVGMEITIAEGVYKSTEIMKTLSDAAGFKIKDGIGLEVIKLLAEKDKKAKRPDWTDEVVDSLMLKVYSAAHPRPVGPSESEQVQTYEAQYAEWRDVGANAFKDTYKRK